MPGKHGHPIVLGREMIGALLKAPATSSARDVQHQHREHIEYVEVGDPLVTANVNTPEDYAALQPPRASCSASQPIRYNSPSAEFASSGPALRLVVRGLYPFLGNTVPLSVIADRPTPSSIQFFD